MVAPKPLTQIGRKTDASSGRSSQTVLQESAANEVVFAVVGHVGAGTSEVATLLQSVLTDPSLVGGVFDAVILKARKELQLLPEATTRLARLHEDTLEYARGLQDLGDPIRIGGDHAAVARALILRIREARARKLGLTDIGDKAIEPDGKRRAYILDSIRHPAEVELLRTVYQSAFVLIGIVADEDVRLNRLTKKYRDAGQENARAFMKRDAEDTEKHGQRVSDAFHLADFFLDNSAERKLPNGEENVNWDLAGSLRRLVKIITHAGVTRPTLAETAMNAAHGAQMRSSCLSRQVGAALVDKRGNLVATGTNEVPRAGGGVYGEDFEETDPKKDHRCVYKNRYCSSTKEQNDLVADIVKLLLEEQKLEVFKKDEQQKLRPVLGIDLTAILKSSRLKQLLEFSRAAHAEMDALLRAARQGTNTVATRMFVTTYPCHYCARHLVAAGVDEVQFIEPYPKSKATQLHPDAIAHSPISWKPPSEGGDHVLFRPFVGVAPRLYRRAFLKDRELKDAGTGEFKMSQPPWATPWHIARVSYVDIEAKLAKTSETGASASTIEGVGSGSDADAP